MATYTHRQGLFLAFIHWYRKLHRRSPAEADICRYFGLTPPSVHSMVVKLHELGLITREPGAARSLAIAIPPEEVPELEEVEGPPL
ncbi:MAG: helix-turn-helix domain-containing protein [Isosphaeraceae bacterium]|nr:helix-turn-helix domain-containing protein [Isosphaeraceae bacterium]